MKLPDKSRFRVLLLCTVVASFFLAFGVTQLAQIGTQLPEPAGHINDFAGVVNEKTKLRLERMLESVNQQTGINFTIATVPTTGEQDIFSFSRQLAREWNLGSRATTRRSLLLVISVKEQDLFTQFSRSVQSSLPDGVLGEMSRRIRPQIGSEGFSEVLTSGIELFLSALADKVGLRLADLDQPPPATPDTEQAVAISSPSPSPEETGEAEATTLPVSDEEKLASRRSRRVTETTTEEAAAPAVTSPDQDADESEEVELTLTLPLAERVVALREFLKVNPNSKSASRALELLVSAHATLGDQKLKEGDSASGIEHLMLAISEGPAELSEQLFSGVIAQIPLNLYLRGEREAAFKAAAMIETKHGGEPKRLLALAGFFLGLEQGNEARRLAEQAVLLAPLMGEAHRVLGLSLHISLRLEEAATEYQKALELDPNLKGIRRNLADLMRASGKAEDALALYRGQLEIDPTDKAARAGVVLSLLDLDRKDEAESEFQTALKEDSRNLALLTGAAYWYIARNESKRALELALQAAEIEPRYTWTQIALARSLLGEKRPLDAERAIRFARQYGKFATLDYELATVLAATGLYEEAAEVLLESFTIHEGELGTKLAGQVQVQEPDFIELLALERRAGIFQHFGADSVENATKLKALLAFAVAVDQNSTGGTVDEAAALETGRAFASGNDSMRAFRQLYVASRLLRRGIGFETALELALEARSGVEAALEVPAVTVAVQADEYRAIRAQALASGGTPDIAEAPRNALSNLMRGRIEELAGWALFNLDRPEEAAEHLRRAITVLPEGTPLWRSTLWRLGAALEQSGKTEEALGYYVKSYNSGDPDLVRRKVIERLYKSLNGSLEGLDQYIASGATLASANLEVSTPVESPNDDSGSTESASPVASPEEPSAQPGEKTEPGATPSSSPSPETPPEPEPSPDPTPDVTSEPARTVRLPRTTSRSNDRSEEIVGSKIPATVKLTGRVRDSSKVGIPNVVIVLISPRGTVIATTTDENGNYSFTVQPSQRGYRIIPSREGYFFNPGDKILTGLSEDQSDVNFVGAVIGGDRQ
ncbi:MAG TPA: TPM domain-containing protein [Pyrinomonadaceae bacterium]|nr:TPM domain-containing protein [Pyrinomonadaceae bacterium]